MTLADWSAPELLQQTTFDRLQRTGFLPGETVCLLRDDTQRSKRGKPMAVSKMFLHAEEVCANGTRSWVRRRSIVEWCCLAR